MSATLEINSANNGENLEARIALEAKAYLEANPLLVAEAMKLYPDGKVPTECEGMNPDEFLEGVCIAIADFKKSLERSPREAAELDAYMNSREDWNDYQLAHPLTSAPAPLMETSAAPQEETETEDKEEAKAEVSALKKEVVEAYCCMEAARSHGCVLVGQRMDAYVNAMLATGNRRGWALQCATTAIVNAIGDTEVKESVLEMALGAYHLCKLVMGEEWISKLGKRKKQVLLIRPFPVTVFVMLSAAVQRTPGVDSNTYVLAKDVKDVEGFRKAFSRFIEGKEDARSAKWMGDFWDAMRGKTPPAKKTEATERKHDTNATADANKPALPVNPAPTAEDKPQGITLGATDPNKTAPPTAPVDSKPIGVVDTQDEAPEGEPSTEAAPPDETEDNSATTAPAPLIQTSTKPVNNVDLADKFMAYLIGTDGNPKIVAKVFAEKLAGERNNRGQPMHGEIVAGFVDGLLSGMNVSELEALVKDVTDRLTELKTPHSNGQPVNRIGIVA